MMYLDQAKRESFYHRGESQPVDSNTGCDHVGSTMLCCSNVRRSFPDSCAKLGGYSRDVFYSPYNGEEIMTLGILVVIRVRSDVVFQLVADADH
jgi:hypothetical protein